MSSPRSTPSTTRSQARIPEQGPAAIVHGDYRLDNCMTDDDGTIIAVLDWELCTLGDPLADVGLLMVYWTEPGRQERDAAHRADRRRRVPRAARCSTAYAEASGRDLADVEFFTALGYWKLACIVEGVYARYVGGAMGADAKGFEGFKLQVERCATAAADTLARLG